MFTPCCNYKKFASAVRLFAVLQLFLLCTLLHAEKQKINITLQDIEIHQVMKMLSQQQQVNIVLTEGVEGKVSVNLYNMNLFDAIHAISRAAGYAVEKHKGSYFIVDRDEVGKYGDSGITEIRSFKVQYTKPADVESILKKHLSSYGKITMLSERNVLIIEDLPSFLEKIEVLLATIDTEPKQILIEAKILEVTLTDGESFGLDWTHFFDISDGSGSIGTQGLSNPNSAGLFFQFIGPKLEVALDALKRRGRLRTLSTPTLLAMEGYTAETQVGTRLGYSVVTTINQVTSESIEFLETGIILKVTPSVDQQGRILLDVHPEVSDGSVSDDGIPSKTTTQLSTQMLVSDGQTAFLGGLMKHNIIESREGIPILGDLPVVGSVFSNRSRALTATEIVVLITPTIVNFRKDVRNAETVKWVGRNEQRLNQDQQHSEKKMNELLGDSKPEEKPAVENKPLVENNPAHEVSSSDEGLWILNQQD
ncbi:MAG: secretin N-terminal domain-containing protein [Gammaproteobacteria bacterium]|nr:secretin N-terminal domain-containing protein [Gammaproteobacteria bacterium]